MKSKVMVVNDAEVTRDLLSAILQRAGYEAILKASAAELTSAFTQTQPDIILLDLVLPDGNSLDLLAQIKKHWPDTEVIVLNGDVTFDAAVEAIKRGAYHFQNKPFDTKILLLCVQHALEHKRVKEEAGSLGRDFAAVSGGTAAILQSPRMKGVVHIIERVAPSNAAILITGESGTGKKVIAGLIHSLSPRCKGPLVKINCADLPRELIESELVGSVKGAFTCSDVDREGLFKQAEGGTLLLDEISEMPIETQRKLLQVLDELDTHPVEGLNAHCRIIATTKQEPGEAIKSGKLREDLYYRMCAICIHLPPLRERREDIIPLAAAFLKRYASQTGRDMTGFTPEASDALPAFDWPGNVRQLQNEIQRAVLISEGDVMGTGDLSIETVIAQRNNPGLCLMEATERNAIIQVLKEAGGNKLEAAKRLGIGRQTLYNKIKVYGIDA